MQQFDKDYQETVTLDGVGCLTVRLIRPEDKDLLVAGLNQLSSRSRYLRFFSPKGDLSDEELHYLTDLDNDDHLAIGAALQDEKDGPVAVGLARYVRRTDRPDIAEAAITVVDTFQHRGIGILLMSRLCSAAQQHGIHLFECEFLTENRNIDSLIRRLSPQAAFETLEAGRVRAIIPLKPSASEQSGEHKALPPPDPNPGTARRLGLLFKRKGTHQRQKPPAREG